LGSPFFSSIVIPNRDTTNLIISLPLTKDVPGIVVNTSGAGVEARLSLTYSQTSANSSSSGGRSVATQSDGKFSLQLTEGAEVRLSFSVPGYPVKSLTYGTTDLMRETMKVTAADTAQILVVLDTTSTAISPGGVAIGGGFSTGGSFSTSSVTPAPPPSQAASPGPSTTLVTRISETLARANLVTSVPPVYPPPARAAQVQGSVVLQVEISTEGRVENVSVASGHAVLNEAAMQAVRQWTFKPFVLNGQTIPVTTTVTVPFTLP
jgi:TonB family protein